MLSKNTLYRHGYLDIPARSRVSIQALGVICIDIFNIEVGDLYGFELSYFLVYYGR